MKLCQVGCGEHARTVHGPAQARLARERPGLVLAGCCDQDASRAEAYRTAFGFGKTYSDLEEMLEAERPEAVVLVVAVEATVRVATTVLSRGVPTLLEKPPGANRRLEVDRLIAAAEAGGRGGQPVPHQVAFNRRYVPLVQELRRRLVVMDPLQHLHYEMVRVDRRDPDFSTTAIHGIDAVRYIAGSDYASARFRYQRDAGAGTRRGQPLRRHHTHLRRHRPSRILPGGGCGDGTSHRPGSRPHFRPPRAHVGRHRYAGEARAFRGVADWWKTSTVPLGGDGTAPFELGGFYRETAAFLDALASGQRILTRPAGFAPVGGAGRVPA